MSEDQTAKDPKVMTYAQAMFDFFGQQPGQNATELMKEVRAVNGMRADFIAGLEVNGYKITNKPDPNS